MRDVIWCGQQVTVPIEPVRAFLVSLQDSDKQTAPDAATRLSLLDTALKQSNEAVAVVREQLRTARSQASASVL